jgi:hypothetical protein
MLTNVGSSVFTNSDSVTMVPVVAAEWNHNLFNPPHITTAGNGTKIYGTLTYGTVASVTSGAKPNFTTKSFKMDNDNEDIKYSVTVTTNSKSAYKIVTYVKTDSPIPVTMSCFAKSSATQYGSSQEEVSSLGWTKIITYIGLSSSEEQTSSFVFTMNANSLYYDQTHPTIYFTEPEIYETTYYDYQNHSLWPTDSPFTYFRPGESYVETGNSKYSTPSNYRKITSPTINGYTSAVYSPVSSIIQTPKFFLASSPVPLLKTALPTDIASYKYFTSDNTSRSISAVYEKTILTNKIVIKVNTLMTIPSIGISIDGTRISVDGSQTVTFPTNSDGFCTGVLTIYWNGTAWTKKKWGDPTASPVTSMPKFNSSGSITQTMSLSKLSVIQLSQSDKTEFSSYTNQNVVDDLERAQIIEISPRLEVDLSEFVQTASIDKSLDSQSSVLPISSMNTNSANIVLSGIPLLNNNEKVNIFSSQSDQSSTILANLLRKNIKLYIGFNILGYTNLSSSTVNTTSTHIPAGVFYSDSWEENDIDTVSIQAFDVTRYLQSSPVTDYVANLKTIFEIITNILDMSGFTDYDYDSLYKVCNNKAMPLDVSYFYCNSKDSTVVDTLNKIFVAYQIGAYIDEYGIMKFLSLHDILSSTSSSISLSDSNIVKGGFSVSNRAKPGKISLRYQSPKVKQSPSIQNVENASIKNSPSFIYTTSNDVVWQQQSIDSVGFNYLSDPRDGKYGMEENDNFFYINVNDIQNIFHTFNRDANGYAFIDNEIVSFLHKEYNIAKEDGTDKDVSIKNDLELQAEINSFVKEYRVGLIKSNALITNASGNGTTVTYTALNTFKSGQKVSITGIKPAVYNTIGVISSASSSSFSIANDATGSYVSGGEAVISADYDVKITPTGRITNVERGLFGTAPKEHKIITSLSSKGLTEKIMNPDYSIASSSNNYSIVDDNDSSLPNVSKIKISPQGSGSVLIFPTNEVDLGYQTYSVKFEFGTAQTSCAGLFFNMASATSSSGAHIVSLMRYNRTNPATSQGYSPAKYRYILSVGSTDNSMEETFWAEVTQECSSIINNFSKVIKKQSSSTGNTYSYVTDNPINMKVVYKLSDGSDGENATEQAPKNIISVFLNNIEITGWQEFTDDTYDAETNPAGSSWKPTEVNKLTGMRQKPYVANNIVPNRKFGFHSGIYNLLNLTGIYDDIVEYADNPIKSPSSLREIHATKKPLTERSVSYFYQDREFLNGLIQGQPLYTNSPTYLMQTTPEVSGINYYDIQYTTPAAVSIDVLPVEYMWYYFPGNESQDQKNYQKKLIDEYSLSYSTPINTGFRAKMAIANNSPNMVFLHKEADELNQFTINLNLWTHEIVAPSDPEILEVVIDPSNGSEVAQLDSEWIQSKQAAQKVLKLVQMGIEGFSKMISINIFGNPLIQIGDVVTLSYSLNGISQQKYFVNSISHSFEQGLQTKLSLSRIQ